MTRSTRAGRLETQVLDELWRLGEASVVQIHEALAERRRIAPTTVATILRRMEDKGLVSHRSDARRFLYRPTVDRRELRRSMIGELVDQLFGGSHAELMTHLVAEGEIDHRQLERLRKLVAEQKSKRRGLGS
ncbi:MAG: BlaI/MecI/CopY family transcriptional regulator [Planctomycetota bacterium]